MLAAMSIIAGGVMLAIWLGIRIDNGVEYILRAFNNTGIYISSNYNYLSQANLSLIMGIILVVLVAMVIIFILFYVFQDVFSNMNIPEDMF